MLSLMSEDHDQLRSRVQATPEDPGVYRWLDANGTVLYIGKAKNLRKRMQQYLVGKEALTSPWKKSLIEKIADFDVTVTSTELEALILETNLIKEAKPKYNVLMKDDKNYVYVRISKETYPRIDVVRNMADDGAQYIGPRTSAEALRMDLTLLRSLYPYRTCKMGIEVREGSVPLEVECKQPDRPMPCLDHHIGQCDAPCIGAVTPEQYQQYIDAVVRFLKGDQRDVKGRLIEKIEQAASAKKFEQAAAFRDQLLRFQKKEEMQIVSDTSQEDADFIGVALLTGKVQVVILQERGGKVIGEQHFSLLGTAEGVDDALSQFIPQYYEASSDIPPLIIASAVSDQPTIKAWLSQRQGRRVELRVPERGKKSKLLLLAEKNAQQKARQAEAKWEADARNAQAALLALQSTLSLPAIPKRIEGYDISHMGGSETVGSMVVFADAKASKDQYRSFTIRSMKDGEIDDYKALREVLTRRVRHLQQAVAFEAKRLKEQGVFLAKAKKADQKALEETLFQNPALEQQDIDYRSFVIARREDALIGCVQLYEHESGVLEVQSLWISEKDRGSKLGQSLLRFLLKQVKKGKVYAVVVPHLEEYFSTVGFQPVRSLPPVIAKQAEEGSSSSAQMMFDAVSNKVDSSLSKEPDLLVIDGGKGQLNAVVEVLKEFDLSIPVIGLAKREEEVFVPGNPVSLLFKEQAAKILLMRLRDEAHRFANVLREKKGKIKVVASSLDEIAGIGPETRKKLLQKFGSIAGMKQASDEELLEILTQKQLTALREQ